MITNNAKLPVQKQTECRQTECVDNVHKIWMLEFEMFVQTKTAKENFGQSVAVTNN